MEITVSQAVNHVFGLPFYQCTKLEVQIKEKKRQIKERKQLIPMNPHCRGLIEIQLKSYLLSRPLLPYYYLTV